MKVTLQQIKDANCCAFHWELLTTAHSNRNVDMNKRIDVASILGSNGLEFTVWVLDQVLNQRMLLVKFACNCALQVVEQIKPYCSKEQYNTVVSYLNNPTTDSKHACNASFDAIAACDVSTKPVYAIYACTYACSICESAGTNAANLTNSGFVYTLYAVDDVDVEKARQVDYLKQLIDQEK